MKKTTQMIKAIALLICFALTPGDAAFAQKTQSSATKRKFLTSAEIVFEFEQMLKQATNECTKMFLMTKIAPAALADGNTEKAKTYAQTLMTQAETMPKSCFSYGRAIHYGNLVLGHIALASGNIAEAKFRLLEAGKTPGDAGLDTFGPNMSLAAKLLEINERAVVLEYLNLCAKFWKSGSGDLRIWRNMLKGVGYPDFGEKGDSVMGYRIDAELLQDIQRWIKSGKI